MAHQPSNSSPIDDQVSFFSGDLLSDTQTTFRLDSSGSSTPSPPSSISSILQDLVPIHSMINAATTTTITTITTTTATATSPSSLTSDNRSEASTLAEEYKIKTLNTHNIDRLLILPMFPSSSTSTAISSRTSPCLLLPNIPIEYLTKEQYDRIQYGAYSPLFELEINFGMEMNTENNILTNSCESFLLCLYETLYNQMKKRLRLDIPIIDYNLTRLLNCISKVVRQRPNQQQTMLNMNELPLAFEFYLQFDVDIFFLKTCSFNGVQPRLIDNRLREGLFCLGTPEARFTITPCHKKRCLCCHSPCSRHYLPTNSSEISTVTIPFSMPHIHRFVNQYEAILNCPATCETQNCIYVLTCPCGQYDFIGYSNVSFAETLACHREEGNRIIREFLIGETNVNHITFGLKSDQKKMNDQLWLYQHSSCCSIALQFFLDYNPDYWCFVPMKSIEVNLVNASSQRSSSSIRRRTDETSATTTATSLSTFWTRTDEEVRILMENLPKPPLGFDFSMQQHQEQRMFFKQRKDHIIPRDHPDLYNANIIAILPDNTSELFHQLIESLFITHAECKLNEIGHLIYKYSDPNRALHHSWCANLTRRTLLSFIL